MTTAISVILFLYGIGMLIGPVSILMIERERHQPRTLLNKSVSRKKKAKFLACAFVGSWIFYVAWARKEFRRDMKCTA